MLRPVHLSILALALIDNGNDNGNSDPMLGSLLHKLFPLLSLVHSLKCIHATGNVGADEGMGVTVEAHRNRFDSLPRMESLFDFRLAGEGGGVAHLFPLRACIFAA